MIPPQSWVWMQISGFWTECFLGNQWLSWGSSRPQDSAWFYWPGQEGSKTTEFHQCRCSYHIQTHTRFPVCGWASDYSSYGPSCARCDRVTVSCCKWTRSPTSVTVMKPDNFRVDISFSAVLTFCVSAPEHRNKRVRPTPDLSTNTEWCSAVFLVHFSILTTWLKGQLGYLRQHWWKKYIYAKTQLQ